LPEADFSRMEGLLERLVDEPFNGRADLPYLGEETGLTDEELLPVADALALLDLAHLAGGDLSITALGQRYVAAEFAERQTMFGQQLLARVPLAAHIRHSLLQEPSGEVPLKPFLDLLSETLSAEEAQSVLDVVIEWGRHGEVYAYNYNTDMIQLPESEQAD